MNKKLFDQLFPGALTPETIEPLIHKGEWAIHAVLPILLEQIGPAKVRIATFSISEDSIRPLFFLADSGLITELKMLLDTTVKRHKLDLLLFALNVSPLIKIDSNHAKILLVENDSFKFGIVGSANLNQPKRVEAGFYFTSSRFFEFFSNEFEKYYDNSIPYELE